MFPTLVISLSLATACIQGGQCTNALVGKPSTPTIPGEYTALLMRTKDPGYGGDFFVYDEHPKFVYAVHRTWTQIPSEKREWRISQSDPSLRHISNGCINIPDQFYGHMVAMSMRWNIVIEE